MKRVCLGVPGQRCRILIPANQRRCPRHQTAINAIRNARKPAELRKLYGSSAWKRLRKEVVATGVCFWCGAANVPLVADHVVSPLDDADLALDPENLRPSCIGCNNRRRRRRLRPVVLR